MATPAYTLASQPKAAASTGLKSPVLPHESQEQFDLLLATCRDEFEPEGEHENFLVDTMANSRWRLLRIQRLESQAFEQILTEPGGGSDPDARILEALSGNSRTLDILQRYAAAAERSYYRAHRELEKSRARQQKAEAKAMDTYIKQVVFAPTPGERARVEAKLQNEAKPPAGPPQKTGLSRRL